MADNKQKKNWYELLGENDSKTKIGEYKESTGGGTPMRKGQKIDYVADNVQEAESYRKEHPKATVRVQQPRDEDGQFTYNSANRRGLKYGPSRGKTIPPFLLGTQLVFANSTGQATFVALDGKRYTLPKGMKSIGQFAEKFQEYVEDEGFDFFGEPTETIAKGKGGVTRTQVFKVPGKDKFISDFMEPEAQSARKGPMPRNVFTKSEATPEATPNDGVDYSQAKSDPQGFVKANREEIKGLVKMADEKGVNLNVKDMVDGIANGSIKSFDDIRKALEGNE